MRARMMQVTATLLALLALSPSMVKAGASGTPAVHPVLVNEEGSNPGGASSIDPDDDVFGLSYSIELVEAPGAQPVRVSDKRVFKSGERIRLHFKANATGAVTIIEVADSGTSSILFPNVASHMTDNILRPGIDRPLPGERAWFKFDNHPGVERLLILFARSQAELDRKFSTNPNMDVRTTAILVETAKSSAGSKGLTIDSEEDGLTMSNTTGAPLILEIDLKHQ